MDQNWFCIGQSGKTIDGRHIDPQWLIEAAADYNPAVYGARLNVEHFRTMWPGSDLAGYGDVAALKTEKDGDTVKMFAQINPTEKLIELNKNREKVYTSMELVPNFAGTGKAYLVGLAITDSPASLGTSMLQFSQTYPSNFISESIEMTEQLTDGSQPAASAPPAQPTTQTSKETGLFAALLEKLTKKEEQAPAATTEQYAQLQKDLADSVKVCEHLTEELAAQKQELSETKAQLTSLTEKLSQTRAAEPRQPHGGGGAGSEDFY